MSQYNPSIYEAPRIGPRTVRGEEGEDVTVIDYWSPVLADSYRSPTGLYDKYVAALVGRFMELESAYGEQAKQWCERQPMSYWLAQTAKAYRAWGFSYFGAESKKPLLPKYRPIPKSKCLMCNKILSDFDGRATMDFYEADGYLDVCREHIAECIRNQKIHSVRLRWTFISKGSFRPDWRDSKWTDERHRY